MKVRQLVLLYLYFGKGAPDIRVDADRLIYDCLRADCLFAVYAGIDGFWIPGGHLPERVFYNSRGVVFIAHHFLEAACRY